MLKSTCMFDLQRFFSRCFPFSCVSLFHASATSFSFTLIAASAACYRRFHSFFRLPRIVSLPAFVNWKSLFDPAAKINVDCYNHRASSKCKSPNGWDANLARCKNSRNWFALPLTLHIYIFRFVSFSFRCCSCSSFILWAIIKSSNCWFFPLSLLPLSVLY